jgi:hypothetical protein
MKTKWLSYLILITFAVAVHLGADPAAAEDPSTAPQKVSQEEPPPPPPQGVSPARPDIKQPPLPILRCPHCGKEISKPWGNDFMYRPHLSAGPGEIEIIKESGAPDGFRKKIVHKRMPQREFAHKAFREKGKSLDAEKFLMHAHELGLTDEQKSELMDLVLETKKSMIDLRANLQKANLALKKLLHEDDPRPTEIKQRLDAIAKAQVDLKFAVISSSIKAKKMLTKEQRELLEENIYKHKSSCCEEHMLHKMHR